jgi:hypothetical protein
LLIGALLGGIALCWILLTPPGAGPDEPSHLARAGAVVRGDLDGEDVGELSLEAYDLPDSYRVPEPGCHAFQPTVAASCVEPVERTGATVSLLSRADEYPIWGHLTFGLASRLPILPAVWWARLAGAAVAVALTATAISHGRRPLVAAGVIAATTPMAWSTYAIVNPSAFGIAGAVALWASLLDRVSDRTTRWLFAFGWVALALPRRDGLVWACIILAAMLLATSLDLATWWRRLGRGPQILVAASTLATAIWGVTNDSRVSRMVVFAPLIVLAAHGWRWTWRRFATTRTSMLAVSAATAVVGTVATTIVLRARPGGWDTALARAVVGQTGTHLVEAIGVLGWLDTELPALAIIGWVAAIGLLVAASTATTNRFVLAAAAVLTVTIVASWILELYQGNTSGRYWQGRYSLPLLAGVPMLLAAAPVPERIARRIAWSAGGIALVVVNVAAWSAARRWGVGVDGSLAPWRWGTDHSPIDPFAVLIAHAALTAGLAVATLGDVFDRPIGDQPQRLTPSASTT